MNRGVFEPSSFRLLTMVFFFFFVESCTIEGIIISGLFVLFDEKTFFFCLSLLSFTNETFSKNAKRFVVVIPMAC